LGRRGDDMVGITGIEGGFEIAQRMSIVKTHCPVLTSH
jgi:hypothetical protein